MSHFVCPECLGLISVPAPGNAVRVTDVRLIATSAQQRATGLHGFLRITINGSVIIDGVTLRRSRDGRATISFPERRDGQGRSHPIVRPADEATRRDLEMQIFELIGTGFGQLPSDPTSHQITKEG